MLGHIESSLHLNNIILIQPIDLDYRSGRVLGGIMAPESNLHFVAHWPVPIHVCHVDDKPNARVQVSPVHLDKRGHVVKGLTNTWHTGRRKRAI